LWLWSFVPFSQSLSTWVRG